MFTWARHFFHLIKFKIIVSVALTATLGFVVAPTYPVNWERWFVLVFVLFLVGSSAALVNNLIDYLMDRKMERTRERQAAIDHFGKVFLWGLAFIFCFTGSLISYIFFSPLTLGLLLLSFFSYVIWYSAFLKKRDAFGVILGGLPGALPIPIGCSATGHGISGTALLLFTFMMFWQPPHFWLLALHTKDDYRRAGIPILPLVYGDRITRYFIYIYAVVLIPISLVTCFTAELNPISHLIVFALGVYFLMSIFRALEVTKEYKIAFRASLVYLLGYMGVFLLDVLFLTGKW